MRLGGPVNHTEGDPASWIAALCAKGYGGAVFPLRHDADPDLVEAYATAAREAGVVIGEVGAWSNPISLDDTQRREAIAYCQAQLALADTVGARCCVNIAGSRAAKWDGPDPDNITDETFALIVDTTREIIDAVAPSRTFYSLEMMPWIFPDSVESYVRLIEAIDRDRFAVHLDPVNIVNSPARYFRTGDLIRDCFRQLGPRIRSCHAKDVSMLPGYPVHIQEGRPGTGVLDYATYLRELAALDPDTTLILEHLGTQEEYDQAATYIRSVAAQEGVAFVGPK
jgi:sugar phosphate isomerase/epimerase